MLNELRPGRKTAGGRQTWDEDGEDPDGSDAGDRQSGPLAERLDGLLEAFAPLLFRREESCSGGTRAAPALLFVEPGTRLGGNTIMRLRALALEGGLAALAPCPHNAACPLLSGQGGRTWCHFTFDSRDAPDWLLRLSTEAGLPKSGLSLAPLLLGLDAENAPVAGQGTGLPARVLSAPFPVPGLAGRGRYACTVQGLALLEDAEALASGGLLPVRLAPDAPRDAKSRARIVRRPRPQPSAKP
ncbi:MAG: small ribosomal subunit Rsm22 family protein [Desulfovibrio fairfieldensis]